MTNRLKILWLLILCPMLQAQNNQNADALGQTVADGCVSRAHNTQNLPLYNSQQWLNLHEA